jgi:hypothetical protein
MYVYIYIYIMRIRPGLRANATKTNNMCEAKPENKNEQSKRNTTNKLWEDKSENKSDKK